MATWKKVVVSGSNISQLNNDAGYLTSATVTNSNAFSTASYDGTSLLANNPSASLNFASSSGQGLTIAATAGTDTLTFGLSAVPNTSLANSTVTVGSTSIALGATSTTLAGLTTVTSTAFSGSLFGTASWATNAVTASFVTTAQSSSFVTGSNVFGPFGSNSVTSASFAVSSSRAVTSSFALTAPYSGLTGIPAGIVSASVLSSATQGTALLTTNGVAGTTVDLGLETTDSPSFAGVTAGAVTVGVTTDNTINTTSGNLTINSTGGTTTLDDNVVITGNLSVEGTTTYINTVDLLVEDPFILLASGSAGDTDGGIIIDRGTYAAGNIAFGYDAAVDRWGYQSGLVDTTNAIDTTSASGVSGSFAGIVFTQAAHGATKPITGEFAKEGAIYTATNEEIWIYS